MTHIIFTILCLLGAGFSMAARADFEVVLRVVRSADDLPPLLKGKIAAVSPPAQIEGASYVLAEVGNQIQGILAYRRVGDNLVVQNITLAPKAKSADLMHSMTLALTGHLAEQGGGRLEFAVTDFGPEAKSVVQKLGLVRNESGNYEIPFREFRSLEALQKLEGQSFYERLEVDPNAKPEEIESAFQRAMFFAQRDPQAKAMVEQAYRVLNQPDSRRGYDGLPDPSSSERSPKGPSAPDGKPFPLSRRLRVTTAKPQNDNYYQRLGVAENASAEKIETRFYEALAEYAHDAEAKRAITQAFAVIGNPPVREAYDRQAVRAESNQTTPRQIIDNVRGANPMLKDYLDRVGAPLGTPSKQYQEYFDAALLRYAEDPEALRQLLEAKAFIENSPNLDLYESRRDIEKAAQDLLRPPAHEDTASKLMARAQVQLPILRSSSKTRVEFFKQLAERLNEILARSPFEKWDIAEVVHQMQSLHDLMYPNEKIERQLSGLMEQFAQTLFNKVAKTQEHQSFFHQLFSGRVPVHAGVERLYQERASLPGDSRLPPPEVDKVEIIENPRELELKAEINKQFPEGAPKGLLEDPNRPGKMTFAKPLLMASTALWTALLTMPTVADYTLHAVQKAPLLAFPLAVAVPLAAAGVVYVPYQLSKIFKWRKLNTELKQIEAQKPITDPNLICTKGFSVLFGASPK